MPMRVITAILDACCKIESADAVKAKIFILVIIHAAPPRRRSSEKKDSCFHLTKE